MTSQQMPYSPHSFWASSYRPDGFFFSENTQREAIDVASPSEKAQLLREKALFEDNLKDLTYMELLSKYNNPPGDSKGKH